MRIYSFLIAALVLFLSGCDTPPPPDSSPAENTDSGQPAIKPPNIVLIMADDLGWADVGYHGGEIRTPAIDKLAAEGVRLNRMYTYPACTQTRAAFLSGERMRTVGLLEPMPPWTDAGLPLEIETLADQLRAANYATWKVGKWHLGDHYLEQFPNQRGFDHFYGFLSGEINYNTHTFISALDWQRNGESLEEEGYSTHLLTDEAIRLISEHASTTPFFLDLSYNAPHTPLQATEASLAEYAHIEDFNRRRYAAMVTELDRGIERVMAAINARPDADNTLVLFMSDNGGIQKFGANNSPLRGVKATQYEGGIRVPAVAWWPKQLRSGVTDQIISIHDLYPTLLTLAGNTLVPSQERPGIDIWPAISQNTEIARTEPIVFALMMPGMPGTPATYGASVIHDGWKLIEISKYFRATPKTDERYQLVSHELFNVIDDPSEKQNLLDTHPEKAKELLSLLNAIPMGNPIGFKPPPPDWKYGLLPGAEPDNNPPTRQPVVAAAVERSKTKTNQ